MFTSQKIVSLYEGGINTTFTIICKEKNKIKIRIKSQQMIKKSKEIIQQIKILKVVQITKLTIKKCLTFNLKEEISRRKGYIINDNIFKNFKIIHQKVKNSVFKKNLIHPKDSNDLMQKLKRINMKNKALHGNNNIRKYDMDTNFKNKSFVIETDISKLLKAEIYRKGSNYKLTKKNKNITNP